MAVTPLLTLNPHVFPTRAPQAGTDQSSLLSQAAARWHIPEQILLGVYGKETNFGKDVATSSAGAMGPFQFIPTTAKTYGYPETNTPTQAQFAKQVDSAAHYLSVLYAQHGGNWDAALRAYSGGGYGLAEVRTKANEGGGLYSGSTTDVQGASLLGKVAEAVPTSPLEVAAKALDLITSLQFWLRIGEGVAGLVLIAMGLKALTGVTVPIPTPAGPVRV